MLFRNKKINAFGLDISDASIKVLQFGHDKRKLQVQAYADVPLMPKVIENHMIINEQRLAENISRAVIAAKKINTKHVVCSIPEVKSFVRVIKIPKMPEEEIGGALPYELEQDIPVPTDQVYMDWQVIQELPASPAGGPDGLQLLVSAAPKSYIDSLLMSLHAAKLTPVAMELESFATARALVGAENSDKQVLIVDLSTTQTSFIILRKGIIEYTSSVPLAGNAFTESIARSLGVPAAEAENIKRIIGLIGNSEKKDIVRKAVQPILDNIVDEMKNVMKFFEEHSSPGKPVDTILLCGGSSKLLGIVEYVSGRLNLGAAHPINHISLGSPWVNLHAGLINPISPHESLGYATAAGLALRGLEYEAD